MRQLQKNSGFVRAKRTSLTAGMHSNRLRRASSATRRIPFNSSKQKKATSDFAGSLQIYFVNNVKSGVF